MPAPAPLLSPSARGFQAIPLLQRPPPRRPIVPVLGRPPRVHLWHIGCQMNDADHEMLAERFAELGFVPDAALDDADLTVLITCAVRQNAEQKVYGKFRELTEWKQARPGRAIAMTGCMAVEHGPALLGRSCPISTTSSTCATATASSPGSRPFTPPTSTARCPCPPPTGCSPTSR